MFVGLALLVVLTGAVPDVRDARAGRVVSDGWNGSCDSPSIVRVADGGGVEWLSVVYDRSSNDTRSRLYHARSRDAGVTWSAPVPVAAARDGYQFAWGGRVFLLGRTESSSPGGKPAGSFDLAYSDDAGVTWSDRSPVVAADLGGGAVVLGGAPSVSSSGAVFAALAVDGARKGGLPRTLNLSV